MWERAPGWIPTLSDPALLDPLILAGYKSQICWGQSVTHPNSSMTTLNLYEERSCRELCAHRAAVVCRDQIHPASKVPGCVFGAAEWSLPGPALAHVGLAVNNSCLFWSTLFHGGQWWCSAMCLIIELQEQLEQLRALIWTLVLFQHWFLHWSPRWLSGPSWNLWVGKENGSGCPGIWWVSWGCKSCRSSGGDPGKPWAPERPGSWCLCWRTGKTGALGVPGALLPSWDSHVL